MLRDPAGAFTEGPLDQPRLDSQQIILSAWQMARAEPDLAAHPDALSIPESEWLPASAPGTVAGALSAAGRWDWSAPQAIDDYDWWYRCQFRCNAPEAGASLDFGGLASLAEVWLNGTHILSSENMFLAHRADVRDALRRDNELVIRFRSVTAALAIKRPRPRWRTRLASHQNLRWIRTTLIGRMPGWSSAPQPVGPWKAITLLPHGVAQIVSRKIRSRMDGADGVVSVAVRLRAAAGSDISAATVSVGAIQRPAVVRRSGEDLVVNATIRIADAAIWWPHTHGAQPLYDVAVNIGADDITQQLTLGRTAFRTLTLDRADGAFGLCVNGARVFWRGACWSPPDPLRLHSSAREYRRTLELARDAGINMLRVGGTMVYEHDDFYDTCTELGIAVWQDFMFANMDYPAADTAFQASVDAEVTQLLQRIGGQASLAVLCGNSEVEQQAAMLGLPASEWRSSLFSEHIPRLSEEHAPDVPYWPSSPSGGVLPFHVNAGDGHYFGCGPYLRPLSDVRASDVRFASETLALSNIPEPEFIDSLACGAAGAGHHPDWKRGVPRDNGSGWDFEDVRDHYVRELFGVDPVAVRYSDPERYLALGRVACGEVMTRTIAEWRRCGSTCTGALVWLYRDLRPGAGWGMLDYEGAPKAAYYYLARAFRPVSVVMSDEGLNGVMVHAVNDGAEELLATVRLELFRGAVRVAEASTTLTVAPRSAAAIAADAVLGSFTDVSYAYRFGAPGHDVVVATLLDKRSGRTLADALHFPLGIGALHSPSHLEAHAERLDAGTCALTLSARDLALAVRVAANGWRPDDNYFHIAPGGTRTVMLRSAGQAGPIAGWVTALNGVAPHRFQAT